MRPTFLRPSRLVLSVLLAHTLAGSGCTESIARKQFIEAATAAHGTVVWETQQALSFDIDVQDELDPQVRAHFVCAIHGPQVRADFDDGTRVVWDGLAAWVSPETADTALATRRVRAWPWLLSAPLKLQSENVKVRWLGELPFAQAHAGAVRMTFRGRPQPAPSAGYVLYANAETDRVAAIAYVLRDETSAGKPELQARSVVFEEYVTVDGVVLPTSWKFWPWQRTTGPCGDLVGFATLSNLKFVDIDESTFTLPEDAPAEPAPARDEPSRGAS